MWYMCTTEYHSVIKNDRMPFAATSLDLEIVILGNSLAVQCLGLLGFTTEDMGSIPGQRIEIPEVVQCSQKKEIIKKKRERLSC